MRAAARNSGGGSGSATFDALLRELRSRAAESVTELGLLGHANATEFALAGTIKPGDNNVFFAADATIDASTLAAKAADIRAIRGRFAKDAKLILYGCHSGVHSDFLEALSVAFGICVEGFSDEITYCIQWNEKTRRRPDCADFHTSVASLAPDLKSCKGVAPGVQTPAPSPAPTPAPDRPGP